MGILPDQEFVFDVAQWQRDENYEVYPIGSRPKELLIAPQPSPSPLIRPGHHYLFKQSSHNYPLQYWAEILAYRIGLAAHVPVPAAFAAIDTSTGQRGALISWFYDMTQPVGGDRFIHGVEFMKRVIPDFDVKTGSQHNFRTVLAFLNVVRASAATLPSPILHWARTFAFDALIGNTDRHQENWGLLWSNSGGAPRVRFSPAFDNGTSLGHEITEAALPKFADGAHLARYVSRGRHHMKWTMSEGRLGHFEMLHRLVEAYPSARRAVRLVANASWDSIAEEINAVTFLARTVDMTEDRSSFVLALTECRHHLLQELR